MASPSKADEAPAPLRGTAALAAGLRAGRTHRSLPGIGDLGRSARWFSSLTFLSASARRALYLTYQGMRVDRELVRPPDYWTGFQPEELESAPRVRTGDAAYDRLLAQRAAQARARMARAHVPRGLPSTVHRRSYSVAGPLTAPGGVARRLQPMVVPPVPNPANSPQTAAARASGTNPSPASRAGARRGARRDDPSRPRATTPPARRFAAPNSHSGDQTVVSGSRFDPQNAPARVSRVAVPSLLAAATHEADAVAYAVDAPSMPAVEVDALGSRSRMARYARHSGPRTPSMDVEPSVDAAIDEPHAVADEMPLTRQAGRPIAARPLLSAWQNPTVWRSVPSGVRGMRLVPVTVADLGAIETPTAATLVRPGELARMPLAAPVFVDRRPDAVEVPPARRPATTSSTSVASASEASTPRTGATPASSSAIPSAAVTSATTATTTATGTSGSVQRATRPASSAVATTWHALPAFGSSAAGAAATASPTARPSATHVSRQATIRRLGARHVDARRPGRSYAASALGYHATPLGPLGPVQWAVRADQPVLARSMGFASVARADVRPPVSGGLTLVRGGRDGDEPVPAAARSTSATSAATHLRLVSGPGSAAASAPLTADVRRAPTSSQPFVARPGAVAVHGIPAAAWSLLGLAGRDVPQPRRSGDENVPYAARFGPQNVSGAAVAARPGALARLSHGQPVRRRPLPEPMAGGIFVRRDAVAFGSGDQTVPVSGRFSPQNAPGDLGRSTSGQPVRRQPLPEPRTAGVVVVRTPSADAPLVPSRRTLGLPATPAGLARVASTATAAATATRPTVLGPEWRAQPAIRDPERSASVVLGPDGRVMRAIRDPERARERTYVASARSLPVAPAAMVVTTREPSNAQPREVLPVARRAMSPSSTQAPARFREVLRAATGTTPAHSVALPARFRPLADRIVGRRPVRIAHGHASRQALAAVGAQAATTRSTIHLPAKPDGSARTAALVAHELAHVAASSSAQPRFHGGRRTREEDEAIALEHVVGRIARSGGSGRGPANVGTKDLPVAGFVGVRGATSGPPVPASATASASASGGSPATQTTTFTRASNGSVIQRTPDASGASGGGGDSDVIRRTPSSSSSTRGGRGSSRDVIRRDFLDVSTLDESPSAIAGLSDAAIDALVASLEDRLIEALERRGGLWRGGF